MLQESNVTPENSSSPTYLDYFKTKVRNGAVSIGGYAGGSMAVRYGVPMLATAAIGYTGLPVALGALLVVDRFAPSALAPVYLVGSKLAEGVTSLAIDGVGAAMTFAYTTPNPNQSHRELKGSSLLEEEESHEEGWRHPLDTSLRI